MDISTLTPDKQVKLQYWLDVIRQCRASGLTNQVWCEQHDISLKSYYYWIAKIRKLALEELPRKGMDPGRNGAGCMAAGWGSGIYGGIPFTADRISLPLLRQLLHIGYCDG